MLDLDDIQGDVAVGLQKDAENFIFFQIADKLAFKRVVKQRIVGQITSAKLAHQRELMIQRRQKLGLKTRERFPGLNVGFTANGMTRLIGDRRQSLHSSFERGADHPETIKSLIDPPCSAWIKKFIPERIDGVFLITGRDRSIVTSHSNQLLAALGIGVRVVYAEMGNTRPGAQRGHEHFGFLDGVSQPGIRGLTPKPDPIYGPDQGLAGRDLLWPGEFVFGYPGQHPDDPVKQGPPPEMATPWLRNGSYMVFRRLVQKVPEFRKFVAERAAQLGMDRELLAARMVGRWKTGAPLELAPLRDNPGLGGDEARNNDFGFADDRFQRKCPYAAHILSLIHI